MCFHLILKLSNPSAMFSIIWNPLHSRRLPLTSRSHQGSLLWEPWAWPLSWDFPLVRFPVGLLLLDPMTACLPDFLLPYSLSLSLLPFLLLITSSEMVIGKPIFCMPEKIFILLLNMNKILCWNSISLSLMKTLPLIF